MRRVVTTGADLPAGFDLGPAVADGPEPFRDELVARIVDVIEVPYLKPIAPRFRRPRVSCPIVRRPTIHASITDIGDSRVDALNLAGSPAGAAQPEPVPESPDVKAAPDAHTRVAAMWPAAVIGAITGGGYVLGRVMTSGLQVLGGALAVGIALLVACVVAAVAMQSAAGRAGRVRIAAAMGVAVVVAAAVAAGAGALPRA
jgi:hypothetical protein